MGNQPNSACPPPDADRKKGSKMRRSAWLILVQRPDNELVLPSTNRVEGNKPKWLAIFHRVVEEILTS